MNNSPSVEGVAGEARWGSVGKQHSDVCDSKYHRRSAPDTTPSFFAIAKKSTPSKKGEFTSSAFIISFTKQNEIALGNCRHKLLASQVLARYVVVRYIWRCDQIGTKSQF